MHVSGIILSGGIVALAAGFAQAGAIIELIPDDPGPYYGGESVTVDFWLHNPECFDTRLSWVQFDFTDTHQALSLDPTFTFDFSSLESTVNAYGVYSGLPVPWIWNPLECLCPEAFLPFPGEESLHIGGIGVLLPTEAGVYEVDALNADEPDILHGARIDSRYPGPTEIWRAFDGHITGGAYDFVIIPEPASLWFFVFGVFALMRGRRPERHLVSHAREADDEGACFGQPERGKAIRFCSMRDGR